MRGRPNHVAVGEVHRRAFVAGLRSCAEPPLPSHQTVEDDLLVPCPVTAVGKDKDRLDLSLVQIQYAGVLVFFVGQFSERGRVLPSLDDVAWRDDILESISFGHSAALLALATDDQNRVVVLSHFPHGGVAADELIGGYFKLELATEIKTSFLLGLATAVGKEDIGTIGDMVRINGL